MRLFLLSVMLTLTLAFHPLSRSPSRVFNLLSLSTSLKSVSGDEKVAKVREVMKTQGIDAIIIPTDDPHMSEYTAPYYGRREFVSGFTGSAGTALITRNMSVLFTDGRYHKQAEMELPPSWTLMKAGLKDVPTPIEFLQRECSAGMKVGIDPFVHSAESVKNLQKALEKHKVELVMLDEHPVDHIWSDRPAQPFSLLREHFIRYAGLTRAEKFTALRKQMQQSNAKALIVSALDEVMWLFNIRGADVPFNPVAICYAVLSTDSAHLFIELNKLPPPLRETLEREGVSLHAYDSLPLFVKDMGAKEGEAGRVWVDPKTLNAKIHSLLPSSLLHEAPSPLILSKALKNEAEVAGMVSCHERDGAAMCSFLSHLEEKLGEGQGVTEVEIDHMLSQFRERFSPGLFLCPSFATIAGVNDHAAIIHYRAEEVSCSTLTSQDLLLLDSGGQYLDGTTDVTRTFHFGTPTDFQKEMYTAVLKGHLLLSSSVFPANTPGCLLDSLSRLALWKEGRNFNHGTGHGVGAGLNVHEGPQRISPLLDPVPLQCNMVVSNEPGYYENGQFGIRIENLLLVRRAELSYQGREFFKFQPLTLIPIQKKMIIKERLSPDEREYLNAYHMNVREKIFPLLQTEKERKWLVEATEPL